MSDYVFKSPYITTECVKEALSKLGLKRCFMLKMSPISPTPFPGVGLLCGDDDEYWVVCSVVEDRYALKDNYKITLQAEDQSFGVRHFYLMDIATSLATDSVNGPWVRMGDYSQAPTVQKIQAETRSLLKRIKDAFRESWTHGV